ncbi:TfoX/Sxy family protein [Tropicibacter naphthalenivorans]|uniref:Regulator of competence-specific genes n=1 Tax=Tropicibacter naphthalenivorans TaxID=441103 RepID=A0A0P1GX75_9RHOB|nr:TfoX/Sxy family protein [Tropicibacter naphthalenivorans]CUH80166.1 Regulator of competence-specific genes [Tropicibacter naphthalenivorans]SMC84924.1 TfoX C-terminal domain-containing protein [Tropicibacter naphthalenivorans]
MSTPVSSIRNLGPAVERECAAAGIPDAETLRKLGAHEAYRRMLASGTRPHFIGYYVLHMALQGRPWNDCKADEKAKLRTAFDALKAEIPATPKHDTALLRALDEIGVIEKPT